MCGLLTSTAHMWATEPSTHGGKEGEAELARDRNWFSIVKRPILKLPQLLFLVTGFFLVTVLTYKFSKIKEG